MVMVAKVVAEERPSPEPGKLVEVRGRPAVIEHVVPFSGNGEGKRHLVHVKYVDEHPYPKEDSLLWEAEHQVRVRQNLGWPELRNLPRDSPAEYRAYVDAVRWTSLQSMEGHLRDNGDVPFISPWSAAVQVEDFQLVPLLRALSMPRVSLLLADDVGLGKTIQAGLIATELLVRRGIRRMLVVCPASLQYQWQDEMRSKFHLDFTVMDAERARRIQLEHGSDVNPWSVHQRVIVSMDFLKQVFVSDQFERNVERLRKELGPGRNPWDLLIVDEAHNVAPNRLRDDSQRTALVRKLIWWFEHRLFLTATPHNGYVESFTGLLELVDPHRFIQRPAMTPEDHRHKELVMVRRLKSHINAASSTPKFPKRHPPIGIEIRYSPQEKALFQAMRDYRTGALKALSAEGKQRANLGRFLFSLLMKRLLSSPYAFARTWWRHVGSTNPSDEKSVKEALELAGDEDVGDDAERSERDQIASAEAGSWLFQFDPKLRNPADGVSRALRALGWDEKTTEAGARAGLHIPDAKIEAVLSHIRAGHKQGTETHPPLVGPPNKPHPDERLLLFTEYRDTQRHIEARLEAAGYKGALVRLLYGGMSSGERDDVKELFNDDKSNLRILLATDAASEGLNLQQRCRYVAHYEIPWNPMRLEQRNGRVDRHGQPKEEVFVFHYNSREEEEDQFLARVIQKVDRAREDLGSVEGLIDSEVRARLVEGHSQLRLDEWEREVDLRKNVRSELITAAPDEADFRRAQARFELASAAYGLNTENIQNLLSCFLTKAGNCSLVSTRDGWEIRGARGKLKKALERHLGDQAGNLPRLVFDPDFYMVKVGGNREVYQPRYGTQLIRLGHPVTQAALGHYRRSLWSTSESGLNRWTLECVRGKEAFARFDLLVTVRNKLQEVVHSRLESLWFHYTQKGLARMESPGLIESVGPADDKTASVWQVKIGEAMALQSPHLSRLGDEIASFETKKWVNRMDEALRAAEEIEVGAYEAQIKALSGFNRDHREKAITDAKRKLLDERGRSWSIDPSKNAELRAKLAEYDEMLKPESLDVWARNQDTLADRLRRERDRIVEHVLPNRYSLSPAIEVVEVGVHAFVPGVGR